MVILRKKWILCLCCLLMLGLSFANPVLAVEIRNKNEVLKQIDEYVVERMKVNNIKGASLAIANNDHVFYTKGYGGVSEASAITSTTPLPIASLSKSFTALAVLQLVEKGEVDLDAPYCSYFSDSSNFSPTDERINQITVRQLLHQTSGLTDKVNPDMTRFPQYEALKETNISLNKVKLSHNPGEAYSYHNPNYQYLALLVEQISGQSFSSYLDKNIFKPLRMNHTFNVSSTAQINENPSIPSGHYIAFGHPVNRAEPSWFIDGPAGIISTAEDMAKWMLAQYNGHFLTPELMQQYHAAGQVGPYGMGWIAGEDERWGRTISHGGIFWTYKAEEIIFVDQQLGITMLFTAGLNAFVDYTAIVDGIAQIMMGEKAESTTFNSRNMEIVMIILIVATALSGIYTCIRMGRKTKEITTVKWITASLLNLLPILILLFLSPIATFIGGGRVVPLIGLWMAMPSLITFLVVVSLVNLAKLVYRIHLYVQIRSKSQPM
ncbi:serine hydrolase domain-containing protein [Paenibacillus arenosi]|uniref:Serine hydrolase n=1 Tax=Paenibacillus arenosi TaxID=2774142 RepID=A0ABR9B4R9_9BACL|nr:serine hydrolase domain-containing protein [Paenibacillus arenosi]MBD8500884.1 serine hydrolase [Paenibacillus arenosi]